MNRLKKIVALLTLAATLSTSAGVLNADYCSNNGNCGSAYDDCCQSCCMSPSVIIGTVALVAVIAVIVHNKKNHHGHSHAHS